MKIGYVAKHDSGGNDDEGAIHFALEALGHRVERLRESRSHAMHKLDCDFLLFHHFPNPLELTKLKCPKVFWCFDRIVEPDCPELALRNTRRGNWARQMLEACDLGFFTDGDWVSTQPREKAYWLMQGADERITGVDVHYVKDIDILFMGGAKGCGAKREAFVELMQRSYGSRFHWAQKTYREELRRLIGRSKVVVAPPFPWSLRYWSNRAYIALGFGAMLVHPPIYDYKSHADYMPYMPYIEKGNAAKGLLYVIEEMLALSEEQRRKIAFNGLSHTMSKHLYRHRCEELINVVKQRLV